MTQVRFNNRPVARQLDNFLGDFFNLPSVWSNPVQYSAGVPVNITETTNAYVLELNAPGRNKEDFKINIEKNLLTVSFEKKEESKVEGTNSIRKEFTFESFKRSFSLDEKIDVSNIQAKYENGILKIDLPKKEQAVEEPKQITIS
jgi:HSP20 family protein